MAMTQLQRAEAAVGLDENLTIEAYGETFSLRRTPGSELWYRYQVFSEVGGPAGYLVLHECEVYAGQWRLRVFDHRHERLGAPDPAFPGSQGCVASAREAVGLVSLALALVPSEREPLG